MNDSFKDALKKSNKLLSHRKKELPDGLHSFIEDKLLEAYHVSVALKDGDLERMEIVASDFPSLTIITYNSTI